MLRLEAEPARDSAEPEQRVGVHPARPALSAGTRTPPGIGTGAESAGTRSVGAGDGLWHTATGHGGYALKLADVERGQAVLKGTIREANVPTVLVARLRVANRVGVVKHEVTEVETLVICDQDVAQRLDEIGAGCARLENGLVLASDPKVLSPRG